MLILYGLDSIVFSLVIHRLSLRSGILGVWIARSCIIFLLYCLFKFLNVILVFIIIIIVGSI